MQKADPTPQSPYLLLYHYILSIQSWFFFSTSIGWPTADFYVIGGQWYKKDPHLGPLLKASPESGSLEESALAQS